MSTTVTHSSVIGLPRNVRTLYEASTADCLRWIAGQAAPGVGRVALVVSAAAPDTGPDALVAVPLGSYGLWEEEAAAAVAAWEKRWLLIESMPQRHRDEARADLQAAVATALIGAAYGGVDLAGAPDVGF